MRFEVDACRVFYCTLSERRLVADSCVLGREFFFSLKKNGYVYYTTRLLRNAANARCSLPACLSVCLLACRSLEPITPPVPSLPHSGTCNAQRRVCFRLATASRSSTVCWPRLLTGLASGVAPSLYNGELVASQCTADRSRTIPCLSMRPQPPAVSPHKPNLQRLVPRAPRHAGSRLSPRLNIVPQAAATSPQPLASSLAPYSPSVSSFVPRATGRGHQPAPALLTSTQPSLASAL